MISIDLGTIEYYDSDANEFVYEKGGIVRFEYSLRVVYDWEGKWKKPFLKGDLTNEELLDFYMMMAQDPFDKKFMTGEVMKTLSDYIANEQTATTFSNRQNKSNNPNKLKHHTAEEIYALMFASGIPLEFENRNLSRLLVMLRIIASHNTPPEKMNKQDILRQNAALNAQRKAQMKTRG